MPDSDLRPVTETAVERLRKETRFSLMLARPMNSTIALAKFWASFDGNVLRSVPGHDLRALCEAILTATREIDLALEAP